ncbi:flagellar hook-basal body complex protein FliE [Pleionea litopenaei]|uniref:Flagellar hook-basal body complex protein FliE n=1 Tax=Pleionea litopenaei TaxID=3070815 RepID=A0AA51RU63_9GAMM|nr:flagellar hook-basal body complex protein FliE [Pleionea sp. HL-JVS1]WMS87662.1 flagellar hook-basal body complex protein FliE [Pleionea sp. HL-JVS1]
MTQITPQQLLAQMRQLTAAAQNTTQPTAGTQNQAFTSALSDALKTVNDYQSQAAAAANRIESGDGGVSLVKAMIASQKSSVAFDAAVQVRNRVVSAYQDIMNMPI